MTPLKRPVRLQLAGGPLGDNLVFVRCLLSSPAAPVEIIIPSFDDGAFWPYWQETGYTAVDCEHKLSKLVELSKQLMAACFNVPYEDFDCEVLLYLK